ncbi:MAG: putative porin, partial [Tannerella sp.]|nr:putative porin [Tannerella sp.]
MKRGFLYILSFIFFSGVLSAQSVRKGFSPKLNAAPENLSDSLLLGDSSRVSARPVTVFLLTDKLGERYIAPMDTMRLNFSGTTLVEGRGLAIGYLANPGSPAQSRIFSERDEDNDFIFANPYRYYITTPENALFYDVKDPYTRITYTRAGGQKNREEMFNGVLTSNFGKNLNIGADFDYTYVRGQYTSNSNKLLYYRLFGNYLSDRYEMHTYMRNYNYLNTENGGITNDSLISYFDEFNDGKRPLDRQSFPTRLTNTWNRIKGTQFFLSHRYNLGFYREMTATEKEEAEKRKETNKRNEEQKLLEEMQSGEHEEAEDSPPDAADIFAGAAGNSPEDEEEINAVFVPVSSIIHTLEYENNSRRFISNMNMIDTCYENRFGAKDSTLNDYTSAWFLKNTVALSLREGFQDWAKFGLTAYINFEKRRFTLPSSEDSLTGTTNYDEFSTYLGAELSKRQGKLLTYKARGEFCLAGTDLGEFRADGEVKTQFRLLGKEASVKAAGYVRNLTPAFYMRHHHSRYFLWDLGLKNTQRVYAGGEVDMKQTQTKISAGVESLQNFIYFGKKGIPEQYESNLQVITARIRQDFRYKAFGWENEVAYQLSSEKSVLPLPLVSAYTNIYLDFKLVEVLSLQIGADAHYHTAYLAPYYEPATQQFQTQDEVKTGNYPVINAYANFKLKQARFFVSGYNLSSLFIKPTNYFSLTHYPLNPMMIKLGISVY